ncbi:MAG: response regulator [Gracilimonas sp.]
MKPLNILIVDDCPVMRLVIRRTLGMCEFEVDRIIDAGDGKEALEWMNNIDFDLVFADLNMPVMSGSEMIGQMRVDPKLDKIPILTVSAESNDNRVDVISGLTEAYVHKPFSPEELRDKILKVLKKRAIITKDLS